MSFFGFFKKDTSANLAKERLTVVLSYERRGLPPNFASLLQEDLVGIFQKYPQFDPANIKVDLKTDNDMNELSIHIPFTQNHRAKI